MWNQPTPEELAKLPEAYSTEDKGLEDTIMHMHFFIGDSDWYVAEYHPRDRVFFGYAILGGDLQNSDWGYMSLDEMLEIKAGPLGIQIDRDMKFKPRPATDVDKIKEAYDFKGWDMKDGS
jgi:hypothetical protein